MAKIPLESTIGATYRFVFTNILSVFGVVWFPILIIAALYGAAVYSVWPDLMSLTFDPHADPHKAVAQFVAIWLRVAPIVYRAGLLAIVAGAMIRVGLMRKALGLHEGPVFIYFSLGAPVWRMILAMILAALIIVLGVAGSACACALLYALAQRFIPGWENLILGLAILAAVIGVAYAAVRLAFFLPAVVVAENRIGLGRSWQLGGGNFWRIFLLILAVTIPVAFVGGTIFNMFVMQSFVVEIQKAALSGHPMPPKEVFAMIAGLLRTTWPFIVIYEIVYTVLMTALPVAATANAYKAVTAEASA
jgi:hypothetical protein